MEKFDVIIIGAGAAGLMCALTAGQRGRRVLLLDHNDKPGAKILISGGGRCNFTNVRTNADQFFSDNPHFCKSALKTYTQLQFIALVEKHKISYHEKTLGQLFCDSSSRDIVDMLCAECAAGHVDMRLHHVVQSVAKPDHYTVTTDKRDFTAPALVLATGGLSIPKMGATDFSYRIATQFGLALTDIRPALVPLTFDGSDLELMQPLSGISLDIDVRCGKKSFREAMVFTHRGMSGPSILQISSCWREGSALAIDLLPEIKVNEHLLERKRLRPKAELKTILGELLPQRLAQKLSETYFDNQQIGNIPDKTLQQVAAFLKAWPITPTDSEGYAKAEVTLGGIDSRGLSSKTMRANDVPGLYVIGEAVDVTGWLGGYNFQWAWSSGYCAGVAVSA